MVAFIEEAWFPGLRDGALYRYELPQGPFESLDDAGMWVSRVAVQPLYKLLLNDLPRALDESGVELRIIDSLGVLRDVWETSLHASGLRLRNARG
jgi:hypothetical protein